MHIQNKQQGLTPPSLTSSSTYHDLGICLLRPNFLSEFSHQIQDTIGLLYFWVLVVVLDEVVSFELLHDRTQHFASHHTTEADLVRAVFCCFFGKQKKGGRGEEKKKKEKNLSCKHRQQP